MRRHNWINLTSGLQAILEYDLDDYRIMRLQSTWCEQRRWEDILWSIPDEFLFYLSQGDECLVFDYGANKETSRACWQGLTWVNYVLHRRWSGRVVGFSGRASSMGSYFDGEFRKLSKRILKRLDYYKSLKRSDGWRIGFYCEPTDNDGDKEFFLGCYLKSRTK